MTLTWQDVVVALLVAPLAVAVVGLAVAAGAYGWLLWDVHRKSR